MVELEQDALPVQVIATGRAGATRAGARHAPLAPGCYLFVDADETVLYVGKSVALRQRLASYFLPQRDGKTRAMLRNARHIEWRTVGSEIEALILESQLIKQLQPPYNVLGREYPHYTFLRLNESTGFPYLELSESIEADGSSYYGPFWARRSAEQTMAFVNRLFLLRACTGPLPSPEEGAGCFYAQTHRCLAPCLQHTTLAEYAAAVRAAHDLLRGDVGHLITRLERERDAAAEELRFEQAAKLHQTVLTLRSLQGKRRHLRSAASTVNFLVVVKRPQGGASQVLAFSAARLRGQVTLAAQAGEGEREVIERFVLEQYPSRRQLSIDLDELDQMHVVAEWLARQGRSAVYVPLPEGPLMPADAQRAATAVSQALAV
jgi:excinuclease UvrABC nuclease subunit